MTSRERIFIKVEIIFNRIYNSLILIYSHDRTRIHIHMIRFVITTRIVLRQHI